MTQYLLKTRAGFYLGNGASQHWVADIECARRFDFMTEVGLMAITLSLEVNEWDAVPV